MAAGGDGPVLHLFSGVDGFRMREAHLELRASLDTDGMLATNTTTLSPRGLRPAELVQHVTTVPFLAGARMVVVEGLLLALGGGRAVANEWQPLLDALSQMPPTNHLVLLESVADGNEGRRQAALLRRSPLAEALRAVPDADVRQFPELRLYGRDTGNEVAAWARERAAARGVDFEPDAIDALVDLIGANLWALSTEIDKLGQYAAGRPVTGDDVRLLTPQAREAGIFDLVDAVVEGRGAQALLLLRRLLDEGTEAPAGIQAMLARQLRHLVRASELLASGADQRAVGEATGLTSAFPLRKLMGQARSFPGAAAEAGLRRVEASDHAVKTGRMDDRLALELLVIGLAQLASRPAAARGR